MGASLSDQVQQTPTEMVVAIESGPTATLSCSHSINNYNQILWYKQQRINKKLQLLGYLYLTSPTLEKGMAVEMGGNANQHETATLTIQNISVESSAVYFCAASTQCSVLRVHCTKTPHLIIHLINLTPPALTAS
ncbi:T cell receptor beta variable 12-5 [Merluccius polli]|nr:T cell receptor beta variable 12-5 [Merluccius polli]